VVVVGQDSGQQRADRPPPARSAGGPHPGHVVGAVGVDQDDLRVVGGMRADTLSGFELAVVGDRVG
jgi:hypothetical protein